MIKSKKLKAVIRNSEGQYLKEYNYGLDEPYFGDFALAIIYNCGDDEISFGEDGGGVLLNIVTKYLKEHSPNEEYTIEMVEVVVSTKSEYVVMYEGEPAKGEMCRVDAYSEGEAIAKATSSHSYMVEYHGMNWSDTWAYLSDDKEYNEEKDNYDY